MNSLWNVAFTGEFFPIREIRQGDPIIVYIYYLYGKTIPSYYTCGVSKDVEACGPNDRPPI